MLRAFLLILLAHPLSADVLAANRVIRAGTIVTEADLMRVKSVPGGLQALDEVVGREARVTLYAGRALRKSDLGAPALVERNQLVLLVYERAGLSMLTEGRALSRGGEGDVIRVINLHSRLAVSGVVRADGTVAAGGV